MMLVILPNSQNAKSVKEIVNVVCELAELEFFKLGRYNHCHNTYPNSHVI